MTEFDKIPEKPEITPEMTDDVNAGAANAAADAVAQSTAPAEPNRPTSEPPTNGSDQGDQDAQNMDDMNDYSERLERLGGEPAPVITPEEFARLQKAGQVHIDARGRVRTTRRSDAEAGVLAAKTSSVVCLTPARPLRRKPTR